MHEKLVDIATGKLLEKFGAGNHKPGSGSASALQGMLSAQMLLTVIDLTNEPKRYKTYADYLPRLNSIKHEIELNIYIRLEHLFQTDSEQFDKVIKLREQRDSESNLLKQRQLSEDAQEALRSATQIPLEIAELCLKLGDFSTEVFDCGFKSARGDSGVALNSAISGVASCLSIIDLNLISLPVDEWMKETRQHKRDVKLRYEKLCSMGAARLDILEKESEENYLFNQSIADFRRGNLADSISSNLEIEELARQLQNILWKQRGKIWKKNVPEKPTDVLKPDIVLKKIMNYIYLQPDTLGVYEVNGEGFEIAGLIDKKQKLVQVSKSFPTETQNFTAAHELGHAILHSQLVLHRDKPIDGSTTTFKNRQEMQADKFAAYFLMPTKGVHSIFLQLFRMSKFTLNESTALALNGGSVNRLRIMCQNVRGLARLLASTEYYDGRSFNSLAKIFGVSIETMAIRLEELDLIEL